MTYVPQEKADKTKLSDLPKLITETNVTVIAGGKRYHASEAHVNFAQIVELLKKPTATVGEFITLIDVSAYAQQRSNGKVTIVNGVVLFEGSELHNSLTKRMLRMMKEGFDISALTKFMENLLENPSSTAVNELYEFLECNELPITPDGHFLAYKKVRGDYKDHHSGTFDNSVGQVLKMPRNQVDDKRNNTCSTGFHFCSLAYLQHFGDSSSKIVILKINPRDVVSIPSDYNNSKGRACEYAVVAEHDGGDHKEAFDTSVNTQYSPAPTKVKDTTNVGAFNVGDYVKIIAGDYRYEDGSITDVFRDTGFVRVLIGYDGDGHSILVRVHPRDLELTDAPDNGCGCGTCHC